MTIKTIKTKIIPKIILLILSILLIPMLLIHPSYAVSEKNIIWSGGDVFSLSPSSNMATEGNYTIKVIDFPAPQRGTLSVNDTIIPVNPVVLAVTLQLYYDILNNPTPIATFTLQPGDEYITPSKNLRVIIDSMPGPEDSDWVYESYNPNVNIRVQKNAVPNMKIDITFTDTNGETIDTITSGDPFLVAINIQNTGEDTAKELSYNITPDPVFQTTSYENKLQDTLYQFKVDDKISSQLRLIAPITKEYNSYNVTVNVTGYDINDVPYFWNNSASIDINGSLTLLQLTKTTEKTTVYLRDYVHVTLDVYNRGPIPMYNVHVNDTVPLNLKYIQNNTETGIKELTFDKDTIGPDQAWDVDYYVKPIIPGIYVLPAFTTSYTIQGARISNSSNEEGFRVYGPIVQLNKSAMPFGNGVFVVTVYAKNIGNGPTRVAIMDTLPNNATLVSGDTNFTTGLDENEEKSMNYTIKFSNQFASVSSVKWPVADAIYYLADYRFNTTSNEKIIEETPPAPPQSAQTPIMTVPVPTIQETERIPVATIPVVTVQQPKKTPGLNMFELIIIFLVIIKLRKFKK